MALQQSVCDVFSCAVRLFQKLFLDASDDVAKILRLSVGRARQSDSAQRGVSQHKLQVVSYNPMMV